MRRHLALSLSLLASLTTLAAQEQLQFDALDENAAAGTAIAGQSGGAGWTGPWIGVDQLGLLHSYWPLDNNVADVALVGANGTNNGCTFSTDTPGGPWSSHSLSLSLANQSHVDLSQHVGQYANLMTGTIAAWVKTTSTSVGTIIAASNSTEGSREIRLIIEGGVARFDVRGDLNSLDLIDGTTVVNDGAWHHLAVVVEGNGMATLYVDGQPEGSSRQGFFRHVFDLDTMAIGQNVDSGGPQWLYDGLIDDVAVWGFPLSPTQITDLAVLNAPPTAFFGSGGIQGPAVVSGSLGTQAFGTRGLKAFGDSVGGNQGLRAGRTFEPLVDLRVDATYYVSCLLRREDNGATTPGTVQLGDSGGLRGHFGWDAAGFWTCGVRQPDPSSAQMLDRTNYFCVLRLDAVASGSDMAFLKVYGPNDTIDASDAGFTGTNGWTAVAVPWASGAPMNQIWITPEGAGSAMIVDEIRIGTSWDAVTRIGFGSGCFGATISQTGRPVIGQSFSIDAAGMAANAPVICNIGISRTVSAFGALPFDLSVLGANGCSLLVDINASVGTGANASGDASLTVPLPADPSLSGVYLFAQWIGVDGSVPNRLPIKTTDGLEIALQD